MALPIRFLLLFLCVFVMEEKDSSATSLNDLPRSSADLSEKVLGKYYILQLRGKEQGPPSLPCLKIEVMRNASHPEEICIVLSLLEKFIQKYCYHHVSTYKLIRSDDNSLIQWVLDADGDYLTMTDGAAVAVYGREAQVNRATLDRLPGLHAVNALYPYISQINASSCAADRQ